MTSEGREDHEALDAVLPVDLADRDRVLAGCACHLGLLREANRHLNLTRISDPREAAVKHVLDSLWFLPHLEGAGSILDLGSGPGFPGIPLALARPELEVHLCESTAKKAAALEGFASALGLELRVHALRAETVLRDIAVDVVVARAAGSARSLLRLLRPVGASWRRLVLSKGPRAEDELEEARRDADRMGLRARLHEAGELPDGRGARRFLVYSREDREAPSPPAG